ncbi:MAG: tRNA glutamyl-Q(34) synthetase GluQRS, partial [Gammaproteobacteria bacterium]|nr:tRNA glutamyl-Q(34) synthetase GluQRS [Gammaproteobacteria bacterium]
KGATETILHVLEQYGFEWDGPVTYQSQRQDLYHDALSQLRQKKMIYACRCSRKDIAKHTGQSQGQRIYPGTCREASHDETQPHSLRLNVPDRQTQFTDRVQGIIRQNLAQELGDCILFRRDQLFAYQLAVSVDDIDQGITEVVRGSDLLDLTLQQIYLIEQLNGHTPAYVHLPVVLNQAGEKLSKQTFARPLSTDTPVNTLCMAMVFLGQPIPTELYSMSLTEFWNWAISHWQLDKVPQCPGIPMTTSSDAEDDCLTN